MSGHFVFSFSGVLRYRLELIVVGFEIGDKAPKSLACTGLTEMLSDLFANGVPKLRSLYLNTISGVFGGGVNELRSISDSSFSTVVAIEMSNNLRRREASRASRSFVVPQSCPC